MSKLKVESVNISERKGTIKKPVDIIKLENSGIKHDAHAGYWNRQVSMLGTESIHKFTEETGRKILYGEFAENITTTGMLLNHTKPLDRFSSGKLMLEVTQIGKKCHGTSCTIFRETGNCVMPLEGIFCRVIKPGLLKQGDNLDYFPKVYKINVITISDRSSKGIYEDKSGPEALGILEKYFQVQKLPCDITSAIVPDDSSRIELAINDACNIRADIIITTGGTGIGPKDFTPDVVRRLIDKEIPGIMEFVRNKYGSEKPNALLSRSVAGVKGKTLIYALPGSTHAVREYLEEINKGLLHTIYMLNGLDLH